MHSVKSGSVLIEERFLYLCSGSTCKTINLSFSVVHIALPPLDVLNANSPSAAE
ncbi:MAG UNVERIFIED_CONTAM: hypothetical protein LVQ98_06220 [Rickettsiaceae bacterium]